VLDSITQVSQGCLQQWERCWARCINSEGDSTDQKAFQPKLCPLIKHIACWAVVLILPTSGSSAATGNRRKRNPS
jgi:hypothetical protein